MTSVTKTVFPVAGLGARFLPATKATPKQLLPIVQNAVEDATVYEKKTLDVKRFPKCLAR